MTQVTSSKSYFRNDIQGLRALAVIAVICNHLNKNLLPSGWLGVDIFFVISGYVITLTIFRSKAYQNSNFLSEFYAKRARRILPALVFNIIIGAILAVLIVPDPLPTLKTGISALFGLSNLYLLKQATNYFSISSDLNFFTQTWSLGVEEQFYLVYPVLISLVSRLNLNKKVSIPIITACVMLSFALFINGFTNDIPRAYYSPLVRFWEIACGCLAVYLSNVGKIKSLYKKLIPNLGLVIVIILFLFPTHFAVITIPCAILATAFILITNDPSNNIYHLLSIRPLIFIGRISYSLYLWHWTVLVALRWTIGTDSLTTSIVALLVTFIISILGYKAIEVSFQNRRFSVMKTFSISILLLASPLIILITLIKLRPPLLIWNMINEKTQDYTHWKDSVKCVTNERLKKYTDPLESCLSLNEQTKVPRLIIIGDSHSSQLVPMAQAAANLLANDGINISIRHINTANMPPDANPVFPDVLFQSQESITSSSAIRYILNRITPSDVVLISMHRGLFNRGSRIEHTALVEAGQTTKSRNAYDQLSKFTKALAQRGAVLLLVRDIPMLHSRSPLQACKLQSNIGNSNLCEVLPLIDSRTRSQQDDVYSMLENNNANVVSWDIRQYFPIVDENYTWYDEDGVQIMLDADHITKEFSTKLGVKFAEDLRDVFADSSN